MELINKDNLKKSEMNSYFHKVRAVVFNSEGKIYITNMQGSYNLPGGGIEEKENIYAAIQRELYEELGIKINLTEAKYQGTFMFYHKGFPERDKTVNRANEIELFLITEPYAYSKSKSHITDYEKSQNFEIIAVDIENINDLWNDECDNQYRKFTKVELEYLCNIIRKQRSNE